MLGVLLIAAAQVPTPQPSGAPLKTITTIHSSPFCTAFRENIKHGIEGVLVNDDLFKRTEPVFIKAAHDMVSGGGLESSFNSTHSARANPDNASVHLDMARLQQITGAVVKNLETINKLLNDPTRFPQSLKTADDRQIMQLRAQLLTLAKQQNAELNVLNGTTDQYMFDTLANLGATVNDAEGRSRTPDAGFLEGGRLKTIADQSNPVLKQNDVFMNSEMGALYQGFVVQEAKEQSMEPALAQTLMEASSGCK